MESSKSCEMMCIEVQINSVVQPEGEPFMSPQSSQKSIKRKIHNLSGTSPKKSHAIDANKESSACDSSNDCVKSGVKRMKKTSRTKRTNLSIDPAELKIVLEDMDDEIDSVLEETAERNKLTATNVKNILRHVITNEYVLAMVRNTMKAENNEDDLEEAPFEPKLTRSKVKELREKQHMLPWPMSTPVKQAEPETQALLEEEFPDESSSDEDYKPNEEECHSEEDITVGSPKSGELDSSFSEKAAFVDTKPDEADEDVGLVIAIPEPESENTAAENEIDNIALRTRSKLPLNDTPLEDIEASLVAPDITVDMYDTQCDDEEWQKFLRELSRPLDALIAVEKPDEEPDDPEEDPEYNALEDEDVPDELDFRFDNSMKITRKELNALMAEIYDYDESLFNDFDDEEEEPEPEVPIEDKIETPIPEETNVQTERTGWSMTFEERLQLEHQMRMYVQLLTQTYLLSFGISELNYINISSKLLLDEIKMFASHGDTVNGRSAFYAHNLDGALDIINLYESDKSRYRIRSNLFSNTKGFAGIPTVQVKKTLFNSEVFIYPELMPTCGFSRIVENKKTVFTPAEDNLIALGLEQFSFSRSPIYYIHLFLVPTKTEEQIKIRIKNSKSSKSNLENPIKYYFIHKKVPPFPRTIEFFDPNKVKAPKDHPAEILPKWTRQMIPPTYSTPTILPKAPKPCVFIPILKQQSPRPKLRKLLPRKVHFSPLKQISPILKKYNQKRYLSLPTDHLTRKNKSVQIAKKLPIKSSAISVKAMEIAEKDIKKEVLENDNLNSVISINYEADNLDASVINDTVKKSSQSDSDETCIENGEISKASECVIDLSANMCNGSAELDAADEGDEEIVDDEQEISSQNVSSLTNNAINKKHSAIKKKNKQQRDLESSLALLQPNLLDEDPKKEEREALFVNSYLLRVTEALKEDTDTCEKFLRVLCKHQHSTLSPVKLYFEIKEILKDYPALSDDFIAFLNPEQAKECGKYKEHFALGKIRKFIRKVEVHFKNQPQHLLKILKILAQFRQQSSITSAEVMGILQPMLKNQSHLMEELITLLPELAPTENLMTDFEEVTIPNSDDENSSVNSCEDIQIPEAPDPYGGKDCPCECHTSSTEVKVLNKIRHCVNCGVKFMDGRVYIQTGKVLKPAHVVYAEEPPETIKIANDTSKTSPKNKQANCPSNVIADQSSKPEVSQAKKSPTLIQLPIASLDEAASNKDPSQVPTVIQNTIVPSNESVPSSSKLPYDVIEDTVFPVLPVLSKKKNLPPDFSHFKEVIIPTQNNTLNEKSEADSKKDASKVEGNQLPEANRTVKWTRDEDKLIIYNCQRFGMTKEAFKSSSLILKSKTPEEVQERFFLLMKLLSKELDLSSKENKLDMSSK